MKLLSCCFTKMCHRGLLPCTALLLEKIRYLVWEVWLYQLYIPTPWSSAHRKGGAHCSCPVTAPPVYCIWGLDSVRTANILQTHLLCPATAVQMKCALQAHCSIFSFSKLERCIGSVHWRCTAVSLHFKWDALDRHFHLYIGQRTCSVQLPFFQIKWRERSLLENILCKIYKYSNLRGRLPLILWQWCL